MRTRRILAFVMALILMCSTFGSASIIGYAASVNGVEVETVTVTDEDTEESSLDVAEEEDTIVVESAEEPSGETTDEEETTPEADEELTAEETSEEVITEETVEETSEELLVQAVTAMSASLEKLSYTGEPTGYGQLYITKSGMLDAGMEFTSENIQAVLEAQNEKYDGSIYIDYPNDEYITAGVWNAAREIAGMYTYVYFTVYPEGEPSQTWSFSDMGKVTGDIKIGATCVAKGSGEGWDVTLDNVSFNSETADFMLEIEADDSSEYKKAIWGDGEDGAKSLILTDENGKEISGDRLGLFDNNGKYQFVISDIKYLTKGTQYIIKMIPYTGSEKTVSGKNYFYIDIWDIGDKNEFTENDLLSILETIDGKTYYGIYITSAKFMENTSLYSSVVAEAAKYLKTDGFIRFSYGYQWSDALNIDIFKPATEQAFESQVCKTEIKVTDGKGYLNIDFPDINADHINFNVSYNEWCEIYEPFIEVYGEKELPIMLELADSAHGVIGDYEPIRDENRMVIHIYEAQKLENNTDYEICEAIYHGSVSDNTLTVEMKELEAIEGIGNPDRIAAIINEYNCKFDTINVVVDDYNRYSENGKLPQYIIDAAIYNAAVNHLSGIGEGLYYTINQEYYPSEESDELINDGEITWHFPNPAKVSGDISIGYDLDVNEYGFPTVTFNTPSKLGYTIVNVEDTYSTNHYLYSSLKNVLQEMNDCYLYPYEVVSIGFGNSVSEDGTVTISMTNVNTLTDNKQYIVNDRLVGDIDTNEMGRYLYISAEMIGKDTFADGDLEDYLGNWEAEIGAGDIEPFHVINIEQKSTDKNIIRKNDYNAVRKLLEDDGSYTEINFTFDSSVDEQIEGTDDWNWYQRQVNWSFQNPSEATKDMTVGLDITPKGENGLKLKALKNTYPASGVNVGFSVDADLPMADLFSETIGEEPEPGEDYRHIGILSDVAKLTLVKSDGWQGSYINGENKTVMQFNIDNAQNLPATECTAVPVCYEGEDLYIGQEGLNFIPNQVMKPGTKATWKSFDTNIGNFNGSTLTLLNEGTFLFASSFKNTNGVQVAEIYGANVSTKLLDLEFVNVDQTVSGNNILTMEMNSSDWKYVGEEQQQINDDWYPHAYLDLRFYPDRAGIEPSRLEWEITGDEGVIELLENNEYEGNNYPSGEIKALKPGEVTVAVRCKDERGNYLTDEKGNKLVASCKVTVEPSVYDEIDWETAFNEIPTVAITNFDKTLADVKLPTEFAWKVPTTSLASFTNVGWYDFPAVYTSPIDKRTAEVMLEVRFITIEGVSLYGAIETEVEDEPEWIDSGAVIEGGTVLDFYCSIDVWNGYSVWENGWNLEDLNLLLAAKGKDIELSLEYDKALETGESGYYYEADASSGGKKTFNLSLMQLDTSKANAKPKAIKTGSYTVTVAKKALADFNQMYIGKDINEGYEAFEGMIGEQGIFYFGVPKDSGFKLTVKNLDTAVSKWGTITYKDMTPAESNVTYYVACVPYEIIGEGNVAYSLTANDEVKTSVSRTAEVYYRDYLPRMQATKIIIDKNWNATEAELPIQMDGDTYFGNSNDVQWSYSTENFVVNFVNFDGQESVMVRCKDGVDVKKGNYKISLDVPVTTPLDDAQSDSGKKVITWPLQLTVTVIDKIPTLNVKQTEKVNLFYTDGEGNGAFTITGSAEITGVTLKPQKDGDALDYTLEEQTYAIQKKDGTTGKNNKATIVVYFDGYTKPVEKEVTIATVNKAPTLVLSSKSDTYYTQYSRGGDLNTYLSFTDKSTGEYYENLSSITVAGDTENTELPDNQGALFSFVTKKNKNTYALGKDASGITLELEDAENAVKATDKFTFYVKEANWTQPVKVSYSIKVDTTIPKLELSSKNVTINKNAALYSQQVALTQLSLKGSDRTILTDGYWVSFSGADAKANQYLNTALILEQHNDNLRIRLNKNDIPKGSYKYNINLYAGDLQTLTTQITVKVVDEAPAKCITVSTKGSIDVLDRAGTAVTYTAKLKNVQGDIVGAELRGTDAEMFDSRFEDGKLVVKAYDWAGYSTKHTYKITPVFYVQGEDFGKFELEGKEQSIKVKQGKPNLTLTADVSNILYRQRSNEVTIDLEALLNKTTDVKIVGIEPLNYVGTFDYDLIDESGNVIEENGEMKYVEGIRIKENAYPQEIIATGKTVTLQFNVYYEGMAVNEKPTKTTLKMVVK